MLVDKQLLQQIATPEDSQSDFPVKSSDSLFTQSEVSNQNDPTRPTVKSSMGAQLIQQSNKQASGISPFSGPSTSFADIPTTGRFPVYSPFLDNEELSAQGQTWYSKAGNAIAKGAGIATSTFLQGTLGAVYGVGKWIEDGKFSSFYNNEFSQGLDQWNQSLENSLPNYYTQAERDANWYSPENLFSANFVFDKVIKNLGYAAGAYASGMALAPAFGFISSGVFKLLPSLAKFTTAGGMVNASVAMENGIANVANTAKVGKIRGLFAEIGNKFAANYNLLNPTQRVLYAGLMSTGEAGLEALQNANEFRQTLINDYYNLNGELPSGQDLDRINKQTDEVGDLTFKLNTALLTLTNTIQLPKIIGSSYNLERRQLVNGVKQIDDIVLREGDNTLSTLARTSQEQLYETVPSTANKFGRITQNIGKKIYRYGFSPSEAFEEGAQSTISVGTENYFNKKNKEGQADIIDDLFGYGAKQTLTTKDGIESILIGGLSGALFEFRGNLRESKERSANTQAAINAFNKTYLGSYLKSATDSINRNEVLQQERVEAIKGGNILESKDLETDIRVNYLTPRIQFGKYDLFLDDISQYSQIASTPEGLQQLKKQGIISEDATQQQVLAHLSRLQEFGNTVKAQYEALTTKYAGIKKGKERVYTDDVINQMVYASSKVDDYTRRIPETSQLLITAGILPQPIVDAVINNTPEKDELIDAVIKQMEDMPILQDAKDTLRQNLADVLEMSTRRKKFLDEYKDIRDNPEKYQDKNELKDSIPPTTVKVGEKELQIGRSYTPSQPIQIINGNLEINPRTQILGTNLLGQVSITTSGGTRSLPISEIDTNDFVDEPIVKNQKTLEQRLNKSVEDFFNLPENQGVAQSNPILTDPSSSLNEKLSTVNSLPNNTDILLRLQETLRNTVSEVAEEERIEQERIDKLNAELQKVQDEISEESVLENPNDVPVPAVEDRKKPIAIRFRSSTSKSYKSETEGENNNYHRREAEFLNLIDSSESPLDRNKLRVVPVTINNQEALGLPGLIPEDYERKDANGKDSTVKNTDPNRGTVLLLYAYETPNGLRLLDKEGNLLNKLGDTNDPNTFVYTHLATTDLTYHNEFNKGERNYSTPNKETTEQIKEYQKKGLSDRKFLLGIKSAEETPNYSFTISMGVPNIMQNEDGKPIVMNNSVVDSGIVTQKDLSDKKLLSSRFPLSDTYLNLDGRFMKLNTHKFTEEEANKIFLLLKQMSKEIQESFAKTGTVAVDPTIKNYLSRIIYFDFPRGQKAKPKQVWISTRGTLHLGPDIRIEPTPTEIEKNKQKIVDFFKGSQQNVNPYQVNNDSPFAEITEATEESYKTARWKSYQHYLLSPVYDLTIKSKLQGTTREAPLTTNIIVPQLLPDGTKEVPLMNKYVTIEGDISNPTGTGVTEVIENNVPVEVQGRLDLVNIYNFPQGEVDKMTSEEVLDTIANIEELPGVLEGIPDEEPDVAEDIESLADDEELISNLTKIRDDISKVGLLNVTVDSDGKLQQSKEEIINNLKEIIDQTTLPYKEIQSNEKGSRYYVIANDDSKHEVVSLVTMGGNLLPVSIDLTDLVNHLVKNRNDELEPAVQKTVEEPVIPKPVYYLPLSDMTERMTSLINENTGRPYTQPEVWAMRTENIEKVLKANDLWYQIEGYETKLVSTEDTIDKIKEFLKRVGTNIETVESIKVNGTELKAFGATSAVHNLIQLVEGKENIALPEEAMHIATELIYANKPDLYNKLLNEAIKSEIYKDVVKSPEYRAAYKDKNGRVNVSALQREAIAKILSEYVIRKNQSTTEKVGVIASIQKIWNDILSYIKALFNAANFNPFEAVATQILEGTEDFGKQKNISQDVTFYQVSSNNKVLYDRIKEIKIERQLENGKPVYLKSDMTKVENTVDQRVDKYYRDKKANKEISDTQLKDSQKRREDDENAHLDINDIFNRYIDATTGLARRDQDGDLTPLSRTNLSQIDPDNNEYYDTLEEYLSDVIKSYPENTQFLFDQVVYDEANDEAGKIDFIAIKPDGTHDELNFKFLNVDTENRKDVPFYDKRAFNIEMSRLSRILESNYGFKKQGLSRTIPIVPKYQRGNSQELNLQSLKMGSTNVEHVNEKYLLPVPSEVEKPKTKSIGKLIDQLNELIARMEDSNTANSNKYKLQGQINDLTSSIRLLQVKDTVNPLIGTVKRQIESIEEQIENYDSIFKSGNESAIRGINAEEISKKLIDAYHDLEIYKGLAVAFKDVYTPDSVEYKKLRNLSAKAANSQSDLVDLAGLQTNSLANRYGVEGILLAEKNVGYIAKKFLSLSDARTASTQLLSRIVNRARQQREFEFEKELKVLKSLQDSLQKAGLVEKAQELIFAKENGKKTGLLTPKYQVEFYKQLNEALTTRDKSWVSENVDLDEYQKKYQESYESFKDHLETTYSDLEGEERGKSINEPLDKFEKAYDVLKHPDTAINEFNDRLQRYPKGDKWFTEQYRQITGIEQVFSLYKYMTKKNEEAYDIGLFKTYHATFFANVKKGFAENLTFGLTEDGTSAIRNQIENIFNFQVQPEDDVYGYVDPITGQPKDKIFAYYTSQISADQKSYDIFKVLSLWNHELIKYKYLSEVENQVKLLHLVESNKNHLETDKFGNIKAENVEDAIAHGNENNSKYLKEFIDGTIYGKRFSTDQPDFGLSVGVEKLAKGINKVFGSEIIPMPDKQKIQVSAVKMVDAMNRWFRLKAMGLNPLSGLSALLGGTANATLNAGTYGNKSDYLAANLRLVGGRFGGEEGKRNAALLKYFMAHSDGNLAQKAEKMSLNQFQRFLSSGDLMILLKKADEWVQNTNLLFFTQNHTLIDGNFVSIPQYVKEKNNYDQLFNLSKSSEERQALKKKIDGEIAEMKRTQSLVQQIKIEGDEISFEGIERSSEPVFAFRDKVQQFTRDAIGNATPDNISQINRTIIGQSLMMFKSWIPSTVATRFGGLRYVVGKDSYDYGRARILGTVLRDQGLKSINTLLSYYRTGSTGQDNLIDVAKRVYQQKVEAFRKEGRFATDITGQIRTNPETGENLTAFETKMTEAQFVDMYLKGFDAAVKDVLATLSLAGILFSMRTYAPDKDDELDPQSKGYWRWTVRTVDKLQDELGFFYNPFSWQTVIGGQIFPSINVLSDIKTIIWNGIANTWLYMNGDEEAAEKMKVAKYVFKNIPGLNQGIYYTALFNSDLADELGIKITDQARQR